MLIFWLGIISFPFFPLHIFFKILYISLFFSFIYLSFYSNHFFHGTKYLKNFYNGCKAILWIDHHSLKPNSVENLVFFLQFYMMLAWIPPSVNLCSLLITFPVWILKELRLIILKNCFSQKQQLAPLCNNMLFMTFLSPHYAFSDVE